MVQCSSFKREIAQDFKDDKFFSSALSSATDVDKSIDLKFSVGCLVPGSDILQKSSVSNLVHKQFHPPSLSCHNNFFFLQEFAAISTSIQQNGWKI